MEKSPIGTMAEKIAMFQTPINPARRRSVSDSSSEKRAGKSSLVNKLRSRTLSDGNEKVKPEKTVTFDERRRSHTISYSTEGSGASGETLNGM